MASIKQRGSIWWVKFRKPDGSIAEESLGTRDRATALAFKQSIAIAEREYRNRGLTLRVFVKGWLADRETLGVADVHNDRQRLRDHVLPTLGDMPIDSIRPYDLKAWAVALRSKEEPMAPKTLRNVYGTLRSLIRSAMVDGVVSQDPCILTKAELGKNRDKDPRWRASAVFSKAEVRQLSISPELPEAHRVANALASFAALRQGEICAVRWSDIERREPLSALIVSRSHDGLTKTEATRQVPIHPSLALILTQWHEVGWRVMMGRDPELDDLIVPAPKTKRGHAGRQLTKSMAYKAWRQDISALKLRTRRFHDLRRTFISLALADGARRDVLERITHQALATRAIDLYTTLPWATLCAEVLRLDLPLEADSHRLIRGQSRDSAIHGSEFMDEIVEAPGVETRSIGRALAVFDGGLARSGDGGVTLSRDVWRRLVAALDELAADDERAGELLQLLGVTPQEQAG